MRPSIIGILITFTHILSGQHIWILWRAVKVVRTYWWTSSLVMSLVSHLLKWLNEKQWKIYPACLLLVKQALACVRPASMTSSKVLVTCLWFVLACGSILFCSRIQYQIWGKSIGSLNSWDLDLEKSRAKNIKKFFNLNQRHGGLTCEIVFQVVVFFLDIWTAKFRLCDLLFVVIKLRHVEGGNFQI